MATSYFPTMNGYVILRSDLEDKALKNIQNSRLFYKTAPFENVIFFTSELI